MKIYISSIEQFNNHNLEDFYPLISADRIERINSFRMEDDKKRSLLASLLLRKCLKAYGANDELFPSIEISVREYGKPFIKDYPDFHFNISHSGKYVAIAYDDSEVGIDIQKNVKISDGVANRLMSENEKSPNKANRVCPTNDSLLKLWAIKESYIKLTGKGLSLDMRNITSDDNKSIIINDAGEYPNAHYIHYVIDDYNLAVCSYSPISNVDYQLLDSLI